MSCFRFPERVTVAADAAMRQVAPLFAAVNAVTEKNQQRVLAAFIENRVSESHFAATTGYGYGDCGRGVLDAVFARAVGAEDALVRHNILTGTHAISTAMFGILRPGDLLLTATGTPYDTLSAVIGTSGESGSLADFGIGYKEVPLTPDGRPDEAAVVAALREIPAIRMVHIQRSRGYSLRPSADIATIRRLIDAIRGIRPDAVVLVDNCYGEFVEELEPTQAGADLIAGSLIKNPGGGIAASGGYIAGRRALVECCADRLATPGAGREIGASLGHNRGIFMGLFHAPHATGEAVKTAIFAAALFEELGYQAVPSSDTPRTDTVQSILLRDAAELSAFCGGIQAAAPVDSHLTPEAWDMPGYDCRVMMAAGGFTMGATSELSADAPMREPYAVYLQGSLDFYSGKIGVMNAAAALEKVR